MNWAEEAAKEIESSASEPRPDGDYTPGFIRDVILKHAGPLLALLHEARRGHDGGYSDERSDYPPCPRYGDFPDASSTCTCTADEWNARIDNLINP